MRFLRFLTISIISITLSISHPQPGYSEDTDWQTSTFSNILLHYQTVDTSVADAIARQAENIYHTIIDIVGYTPPATIYVYLCPTPECFRQHHPGNTPLPDWAVGVAYPELSRIVMRSALSVDEGGRLRPVEVFQHELAHIVLEQALAEQGGAPRWLSEGFSMYMAAQWTTHGQRTLEEVTLQNAFLPLSLLTTSFPANKESAHIAYTQSFSVVAFLIKTYGKYAFQDFIQNLRTGMDTNSALLHATGRGLKSVEQEWQEALHMRYSWWMYVLRYGGFWFGLSLLFIVAYVVKRWKMKRVQAEWERQEAHLEEDIPDDADNADYHCDK